MKITAEISKIFEERKDLLKAAANVILEDDKDRLIIKNVRIIEGQKGLFMSLPARKNGKNEYKEICYPLTSDLRKRMSQAVLAAYTEAIEQTSSDQPAQ